MKIKKGVEYLSGITYIIEKKYTVSLFVVILSLVLFLAGCGDQIGKEQTEIQLKKGQNEKITDSEGVREITHAMGTTSIQGNPKRIVTLYQGATDVAVALGVQPVGAVESWVEKPMYNYLKDELEGTSIVGEETQPNLEEIAKLKPDLIIASKLRHEKVYDQLSQIAPTVTHDTVFKFKETVELMGEAMNEEDKANQLLADWDNRVDDFKTKISAKLGKEWPIKTSVLNFRADHSRIYITGYAGDILDELGFVRSESQQEEMEKGTVVLKLTDKEGIPSMNADVLFYFLSDPGQEDAVQKTYEDWTNHPLWKDLDAVQNDQVYQIDEVAWNMAGGIGSANLMLDQLYDHFDLEK